MVGNIQNFTKLDIIRCFLRLYHDIGRQKLAKELDLGEGTIRSILDILKSKKLLGSNKKGHFLSNNGKDILREIRKSVNGPIPLTEKSLYPEYKKAGLRIIKASKLQGVYKLRDIAVKNGAEGAVIFKFDGKLYAPESGLRQSYKELEKLFDFKNGDVFVMGFSADRKKAENGALGVAVELSAVLKKFINQF